VGESAFLSQRFHDGREDDHFHAERGNGGGLDLSAGSMTKVAVKSA